MLSKCASPGCSTPFRYLHEGKLYLIDRNAASVGCKLSGDLRYARKSRGLEYFWLCSSCCSDLTIQVDDDHGVRVVRKREAQNGSIQTGPSMQLKQRGAYVRQAQAPSYRRDSPCGWWFSRWPLVTVWPVQTMNAEPTYLAEANLLASRDSRSRR